MERDDWKKEVVEIMDTLPPVLQALAIRFIRSLANLDLQAPYAAPSSSEVPSAPDS